MRAVSPATAAIWAVLLFSGLTTVAGHASAGDTYDKEATEMALKRAARQVKENCGQAKNESGKETGPWGPTHVTVLLGRNGHSKSAEVPAPFDGTPPGRCTVQAFSNLTFPPWAGADISVDWDIDIVHPPPSRTRR